MSTDFQMRFPCATDWLEYLEICEDINFRIMTIVQEADAGFAFPSQTVYIARDSGTDAPAVGEVEAQADDFRSAGRPPHASVK